MLRRPRSTRKSINYSKLESISGIEDLSDEESKKRRYSSGSDEFQVEEKGTNGNSRNQGSGEDTNETVEEIEYEEGYNGALSEAQDDAKVNIKTSGGRRMPKLKISKKSSESATKAKHVINLKDRLHLFYGTSDKALIDAFNERNNWASAVVFPAIDKCKLPREKVAIYTIENFSNSIHGQEFTKITLRSHEYPSALSRELPITVQPSLECEFITLRLFQHIPLPREPHKLQGSLLNVGGLVSSLDWAPGMQNDIQYLAVGVLADEEWTSAPEFTSVKKDYAVFSKTKTYSNIQIYRVNTQLDNLNSDQTPSVELAFTLSFYYGHVVQLAWMPNFVPGRSDIGILAACFTDGLARVFYIQTEGNERVDYLVQKPLRQFQLDTSITCVAWREKGLLVMGTAEGSIVEFDIFDDSDVDNLTPSYYVPLHLSLITSITSGYPNNNDLIYTTSTDGYNRLIDVKDIRRSQAFSSRFKGYSACSAYSYYINSFLSLEDTYTSKAAPIRKINMLQGSTTLTRHDGSITTLASSKLHPIAMSGGSDGCVQVGNVMRRVAISRRISNQVYKYGLLWSFEASEKEGKFRFVNMFKCKDFIKHSACNRQVIYPRTVAVTSLAWNPNLKVADWYAAGLAAGLLRIERLV